jgi:ribonuclease D
VSDDADVALIASPDQFAALIHELAVEPLVAVDTEAASFHRYRDMVYLLQVSSRRRTAVVDHSPSSISHRSADCWRTPR